MSPTRHIDAAIDSIDKILEEQERWLQERATFLQTIEIPVGLLNRDEEFDHAS